MEKSDKIHFIEIGKLLIDLIQIEAVGEWGVGMRSGNWITVAPEDTMEIKKRLKALLADEQSP